MSCPNCGGPLTLHIGRSDTAPWQCFLDRIGWWEAELEPEIRAGWTAHNHDWEIRVKEKLFRKREEERVRAKKYHSSVPPHIISHLSPEELKEFETHWRSLPREAQQRWLPHLPESFVKKNQVHKKEPVHKREKV